MQAFPLPADTFVPAVTVGVNDAAVGAAAQAAVVPLLVRTKVFDPIPNLVGVPEEPPRMRSPAVVMGLVNPPPTSKSTVEDPVLKLRFVPFHQSIPEVGDVTLVAALELINKEDTVDVAAGKVMAAAALYAVFTPNCPVVFQLSQ